MVEGAAHSLLAIDIGSSRLKAMIFGVDGTALAEVSRPTPSEAPAADRAEIELGALWQALVATVAELGAAREAVGAVGVVAQLGLVVADAKGAPLMPAMLWSDRRARDEAEQLAAVDGASFQAIAGRPLAPELTAPRLLWLARYRPEVRARTGRLMSLKDWVVARLTGAFVTDETHASYSGLFDVTRRQWSDRLAALARLDPSLLPPARPAASVAGRLTAEAAKALGLAIGLNVAVGASDGTAGAVGAGAIRPDVAVDVAGTTDVVLATASEPVRDPKGAVILNAHAVPGLWTVGGPTGLTGGAIAWMAKTLGFASIGAAKAALAAPLAAMPPGCRGVSFRPTLGGSRFPDWRADEHGVIAGLAPEHGPAELLRAAEEGAAFTVAEGLAALSSCGLSPGEIIVVGGLTVDPTALQLRADALGLPVLTGRHAEASAVGAVMFACVAGGFLPDLTAAAAAFVAYPARFTPDAERSAALEVARRRWRRVKGPVSSGARGVLPRPPEYDRP